MKGVTVMKSPHGEFLDRTDKYILRSQDWSRLGEIARRAMISELMRKHLSEYFHITLVSMVIGEDDRELCLFITPRPHCWSLISNMDERELSQLVQKYEMFAAYISGLDDALPGDMEE